MADNAQNPERPEAAQTEGEHDPTLDIVRQMIVAAEAIPAPAQKPDRPPTPRPAPGVAPAAPAAPVTASVPVSPPVPDADPDVWDHTPDEADWDDLYAPDASDEFVDYAGSGMDEAAAPDRGPGRERLWRRGLRALGGWLRALIRAAAARVVRFLRRPDAPRRLALGLIVICIVAWPMRVLALTLLVPLGLFVTWASVGSDGFAELVVRWYEKLKARDPDKAERIRLRAAAVSRALTRGLDRLPESWTAGLYLPDFEPEGYVPEKLRVDPFEDLAAEVQAAKRGEGRA